MDNYRNYLEKVLDWLYWKKEEILCNDYIMGFLTGLGIGICAAIVTAIIFILKDM